MQGGPIGVLYEHPDWFRPLFAEMDRRGMPYERIPAHELRYDPSAPALPYSLLVNRVSPSSYLRGHTSAIFAALPYLLHVESLGVPVVNGSRAHALEISKARQLALLASLNLPHPRGRVVNDVSQIAPAAAELDFPVIVKPNIGGSGALMQRFDSMDDLRAADLGDVLGLDHTAIVQEFHPPKGGSIVRVEVLEDRLLYAIRIQSTGFNLCPADICCPVGVAPAEAVEAPDWVVDAVRLVFRSGGIDVGGVEYLESERDGQIYLYDVNSLSNFVKDAPTVVGFDPFERFVDYLERRAGQAMMITSGGQRTLAP